METSFYLPIFLIAGGIIFLIIFFHYVPFFLWLSAKVSGVNISYFLLFANSDNQIGFVHAVCPCSSIHSARIYVSFPVNG